jgi:hypothetical protein
MPIPGYIDYARREYCKDIGCEVQLELEKYEPGTPDSESVRAKCKQACIHTTYEFHHWLIEHSYEVARPAE